MNAYEDLAFPEPPDDRPYTFINMVATIDGKTVIGDRGEDVVGLGSKTDQVLMDRIERAADAVLIGGQTVRSTSARWSPKTHIRIAVTKSGEIPFDKAYFTDPEGKAFVACPEGASFDIPTYVARIEAGLTQVEPQVLAMKLRQVYGVKRLHILGGSEINAQFLSADLVDELFLTIAPKVKLGRGLPTYAGGEPIPKDQLQQYRLVEHHVIADEVFLRYRRRREF
jgi:riboflavin biosynthesis pyrimidine reductase